MIRVWSLAFIIIIKHVYSILFLASKLCAPDDIGNRMS